MRHSVTTLFVLSFLGLAGPAAWSDEPPQRLTIEALFADKEFELISTRGPATAWDARSSRSTFTASRWIS